MRPNPHARTRRNREWAKAAVFVCLALTMAAAALDRRNAIIDRTGAQPSPMTRPSPAAMVQDMLTHD